MQALLSPHQQQGIRLAVLLARKQQTLSLKGQMVRTKDVCTPLPYRLISARSCLILLIMLSGVCLHM